MIRQFELVEAVRAYDPDADEDLLNRAYVYSMKAHGNQVRASGDPYFSHPLEVAGILVGLKLDVATIVTALLHDTVEDTLATIEDIEKHFGKEIAFLVNGVTKLSQLELQSDQSKQAENFRKLVVAMSSDIRVLLIKLADRLHNMRTLHYVPAEEKRKRIARETMDIYMPLAERIGMHEVKDELEDLAFVQLHPEARESIVSRLNFLREQGGNLVKPIIDELREVLQEHGLHALVMGREKTPCSIWRKMQQKNITFEQLSDIIAFRIIVETEAQCYQALGIVHGTYPVLPGRFKDYISTSKENNYQSIHTAVIGPSQNRIEIQIRTKLMDEIAEYGVAAHWEYKQGAVHDGHQYRWLRGLLDILENAEDPEDFLEHTKLEMFQDQVFCFSPKGDLITLPKGATPIDFAYAVHSGVGDHCTGAKINGRIMPLRTALENRDQVEIMTSKNQEPSPTWERFVVTGKARASIRRYIRQQKRHQFIDLGKSLIQKAFKHEHIPYSDKDLEPGIKLFDFHTLDDLYAAIGEGVKTTNELIRTLYPAHVSDKPKKEDQPKRKKKPADDALALSGLIPGMAVHFARCCHPVPGDQIVGIVTTGKGVTIHTTDCKTLARLKVSPDRWIDVTWNAKKNKEDDHIARIELVVMHQPGSIAAITGVIARHEANIINIKINNRSSDFYDFTIDLDVKDTEHLSDIIASLRMLSRVVEVERK
ncbi:Bifunctional (p)ppGpp synthetase/guanosine-3',5'-bis(diphosphate) 3'-pyrophosphohydrolase [Candidatus Bealeia paramacronuclearis]|uniref:GTP pyrophosphokinase rsh n=1 Tax=Candidatus Bealeia paramacronuclearis TaxID=1921001 RepID=A0ABZ2C6M1_9PROT|nr:Bifunctional (p)ppGpp synthetase/guanosine-3',5'-bis(diphosphate) 3'-pyrophosphohydrolase [Candidatus Bealeia paramacronuclearis]